MVKQLTKIIINNQDSLRRKIFVIGVVSIIGVAWLASGNPAQGVTVEEFLAQIAELKAKIEALQAQLAELEGEKPAYEGIPAGFIFENNLWYGMKNNEVKYLQIILKAEVGPPTYPEKVPATGWFGPITQASVIQFQEKYAQEILAPWGLTKGTGFVGSTTRAKLNNLLKTAPPPPPPPTCTPSSPSLPALSSPANGATDQSLTLTLSWQAISNWGSGCPDDKKYRIQIDNNSDFSSPLVNTTLSSSTTSFNISANLLSYNTTYYWRVRAENNQEYSNYSSRSFQTLAQPQPDFSLSADPIIIKASKTGTSQASVITVASINGFNSAVTLSVISGLPTGATANFNPASVTPPANSTVTSNFTVSTSNVTVGSYNLTIRGQSGAIFKTISITLEVADLYVILSANPSSGIAPLNVELLAQVSGITTGPANYIFYCNRSDPGTDVIPGYNKKVNYVSSSSYSDVCNYSSTGTYTAKVIVERGGLAAENRVTINVTAPTLSVSLSANPSSGTAPLSNVDLTANVSGTATGPINYTFYCNRSDSGTDTTPDYDHKKDGTTTNPYTALDVCNYSSAGTYTAKVIVKRGGLDAENRVTINVTSPLFDFSLSVSPTSGSVAQGGLVSTTITATLISGASQAVSFSVSGLPTGATASFSPTNCNPTCSSKLTINAASTTPTATYSITVTGTGGGVTKTTNYSLTVSPFDFALSVRPSSDSVSPGNSASATISVLANSSQTVSFSAAGLPSDASASFSPSSCLPIPGLGVLASLGFSLLAEKPIWTHSCYSTMTITTASTTPTGTYPITITGTGGGLTKTASYSLNVVSAFDFSLAVNPNAGTVVPGGSTFAAKVTVTLISGSTQSVSFSASGLPSGATASFSPTSCNPTCSSKMTISTSSTTLPEKYSIAITGTGDGLTKTVLYSLKVIPPSLSVSLSANPSSGTAPLNVDLTAKVSGTAIGPINYTFYCNRSDSGTNITPDYNHKQDGITSTSYTAINICNYSYPGTYTAKVIVEKGNLVVEDRATINIIAPMTYPIQVPILVLKYFPTEDGIHLDRNITNIPPEPYLPEKTLDEIRTYTETINNQLIQALESGSTYHGYKNPSATPALNYDIFDTIEYLSPVPVDKGTKKIIDGDPETGKWHPTSPFTGDYLIIDLLTIKQIDNITLYFWWSDRPESYHIDVSETGSFTGEETRVVEETDGLTGYYPYEPNPSIQKRNYNFSEVNARFIKFTVDKYRNVGDVLGQINLYEFGISYKGVGLDLSDAEVSANEGLRLSDPADHIKILNDINICNYVENLSVKEVWIWMYHTTQVVPVESYQRGPYGGLGNGYMDLPLCQKTYTVYDYNYGRGLGEALEDHTHHIEAIFNNIDRNLFWQDVNSFTGGASEFEPNNLNLPLHCGWTHCPPNVIISPNKCGADPNYPDSYSCICEGYNWYSNRTVLSDCENWKPDGTGEKTSVNCHTWSDAQDCHNYTDPFKDGNVGFKIWWMQNIPGKNNNLTYNGKPLRNWWDFIGDFDQALQTGKSLTY